MAKELLPLCSIQKIANRDGYVGAAARLLLPFWGYWFASGQQLSFPAATVAQDTSRTLTGVSMADTYQKAEGVCIKG